MPKRRAEPDREEAGGHATRSPQTASFSRRWAPCSTGRTSATESAVKAPTRVIAGGGGWASPAEGRGFGASRIAARAGGRRRRSHRCCRKTGEVARLIREFLVGDGRCRQGGNEARWESRPKLGPGDGGAQEVGADRVDDPFRWNDPESSGCAASYDRGRREGRGCGVVSAGTKFTRTNRAGLGLNEVGGGDAQGQRGGEGDVDGAGGGSPPGVRGGVGADQPEQHRGDEFVRGERGRGGST